MMAPRPRPSYEYDDLPFFIAALVLLAPLMHHLVAIFAEWLRIPR